MPEKYVSVLRNVGVPENSTSLPLTSAAEYIGEPDNVRVFEAVRVNMFADAGSEENGLSVEFSADAVHWSLTDRWTYPAGSVFSVDVPVKGEFFRVRLVNGPVAQTSLYLKSTALARMPTRAAATSEAVSTARKSGDFQQSAGRVKTAGSVTMSEVSHVQDQNDARESTLLEGAGAALTYVGQRSEVQLSVTGPGDRVLTQSRLRGLCEQGKSVTAMLSGVLDAGNGGNATDTCSRAGYFDDLNGLFFQLQAGAVSVVVRTDTSGEAKDQGVLQADWNVDRFDGTGPSGVTVDFSKAQLFIIDFEWVGVGSARFGLLVNGVVRYAHVDHNANATDVVYIRNPHLPARFEVTSSGGAGTVSNICHSITSEGGLDMLGRTFAVASPTKQVKTDVEPMIALRLQAGKVAQARVHTFQVSSSGKETIRYELWLFRDVPSAAAVLGGGASFAPTHANSLVECDFTADALDLTGARLMSTGFVAPSDVSKQAGPPPETTLTVNAVGDSDLLVLCCATLGGKASAAATVSWVEYQH